MMMSDVIDERIQPLVATMNTCGFNTFASCEGHGFPADSRLPYVAFYCDIMAAARLEALLRADAESLNPKLNWGWTITGTFNSAGELGFAMRPTRPHLILHRYLRRSLVDDFAELGNLLLQDRKSKGHVDIPPSDAPEKING